MSDEDQAELEAERIRSGRCPVCGADVVDKGTYLRCSQCDFDLGNGKWCDEGYVIIYADEIWD